MRSKQYRMEEDWGNPFWVNQSACSVLFVEAVQNNMAAGGIHFNKKWTIKENGQWRCRRRQLGWWRCESQFFLFCYCFLVVFISYGWKWSGYFPTGGVDDVDFVVWVLNLLSLWSTWIGIIFGLKQEIKSKQCEYLANEFINGWHETSVIKYSYGN